MRKSLHLLVQHLTPPPHPPLTGHGGAFHTKPIGGKRRFPRPRLRPRSGGQGEWVGWKCSLRGERPAHGAAWRGFHLASCVTGKRWKARGKKVSAAPEQKTKVVAGGGRRPWHALLFSRPSVTACYRARCLTSCLQAFKNVTANALLFAVISEAISVGSKMRTV